MSASARNYLRDRFQSDADALHARALALDGGALPAGPNAATSRQMAAACAAVVSMLDALPDAFEAIVSLLPLLERRAVQEASAPLVRAVYVGAATRIREIVRAESLTPPVADESDDDDIEMVT